MNNTVYLVALAASYQLDGRFAPAAACYDLAYQLAPSESRALWLAAWCHQAVGRRREACRRLALLRRCGCDRRLRRYAGAGLVALRWRERRNFRVI